MPFPILSEMPFPILSERTKAAIVPGDWTPFIRPDGQLYMQYDKIEFDPNIGVLFYWKDVEVFRFSVVYDKTSKVSIDGVKGMHEVTAT